MNQDMEMEKENGPAVLPDETQVPKTDRSKIRWAVDIVCIIVLVVLDQASKQAAVMFLKDQPAFDLIPEILQLYYLPGGNTGAAWGLLSGHQLLFIAVSVVVVGGILFILWRMPVMKKYGVMRVLLVLIAAGGIGNMIDRVVNGYVVDFIYIKIINFPIFNVADMYVSCSIVILMLLFLFKYKEEDMKELEMSIKKK
ncbi:MAG: signal peptidase II [Lachnospiraceae bacterium]|nr:signal peptidase II [Lachnospiraceae bacterium]